MKHTFSGNLDPEEYEGEGDPVEDDPELGAIASRLRETSSHAVDPEFVEKLHNDLLQQFIEHQNKETT